MDNILILANNDFARKKEAAIQTTKIMTKDQEYLTSSYPLKFNRIQIKLDLKGIILTKESYVGSIVPITNHDTDSTSSREITRKKLSPNEQYLA